MSLFTHYVEEQRGMIVRCSKSVVAVAIFGYSQCCSPWSTWPFITQSAPTGM